MSTPAPSVNIYAAKTQLSQLVARVERGERVTISRNGRPVAQLVPYVRERADRTPGLWRGRLQIASDFDDFSAADDAEWFGE